uniref:Uncharacterized protein n=1 Tax=Anguilla anguilla TaxID=7936 RepID=A0A0E9XF24_ANGAN
MNVKHSPSNSSVLTLAQRNVCKILHAVQFYSSSCAGN